MASDVIDLLARLVAIDSVNTSLVPGGAGEAEIAAFVHGWAISQGLDAQVVETPAGRPNVLVWSAPAGDGPTLMLCGHLDTVGLGSMIGPLHPRIDGDRIHGRGAYDQKSGLAAALVACRDASRSGLRGRVLVAAVADEEHASTGIVEVLRHVTADAAIVTEPTELAIGIAHKGFTWVEIEVVGRPAHGSRPHLGVDAILKTGPILVAVERLQRELRGREHPTLGPAVVHASRISGGSEMAIIPDRCMLAIERRTLPGESAADVEAEIDRLLAACRSDDPELVASSRITLSREPFEIPASTPIVGTLRDAAAGVLGEAPALTGLSFWADSAFIGAAGIPTVLFGPPGEGAHADVEWASISGTIACAEALAAAARRFCR
jgi:acetylornithine deacetylase